MFIRGMTKNPFLGNVPTTWTLDLPMLSLATIVSSTGGDHLCLLLGVYRDSGKRKKSLSKNVLKHGELVLNVLVAAIWMLWVSFMRSKVKFIILLAKLFMQYVLCMPRTTESALVAGLVRNCEVWDEDVPNITFNTAAGIPITSRAVGTI